LSDWITAIGLKNEKEIETVLAICNTINNKDPTFRYRLKHSKFKKYKSVMLIFSSNKDKAEKRGTIMVKKYLPDNGVKDALYWVKESK